MVLEGRRYGLRPPSATGEGSTLLLGAARSLHYPMPSSPSLIVERKRETLLFMKAFGSGLSFLVFAGCGGIATIDQAIDSSGEGGGGAATVIPATGGSGGASILPEEEAVAREDLFELGRYRKSDGIRVSSVQTTNWTEQSTLHADFFDSSNASGGIFLEFQHDGDCGLATVPNYDGTNNFTRANPGTIQLEGGKAPLELVGIHDVSFEGSLWSGGETLTFSTTGQDIEAFGADITAPGFANVTSPTPTPQVGYEISRSHDTIFEWTDVSAEWVVVFLINQAGLDDLRVQCVFDAKARRGILPATIAQHLATGITQTQLWTQNVRKVSVDEWGPVFLSAWAAGRNAAGDSHFSDYPGVVVD